MSGPKNGSKNGSGGDADDKSVVDESTMTSTTPHEGPTEDQQMQNSIDQDKVDKDELEALPDDLGLAGRTAKTFIHSPLTPLLYLAMLAMGIVGFIITPRQEDPQISVPMVDVFFEYPGVSSREVARLAVEPLQRMMSEIPGVKHVYGVAQRDEGMVTIQFKVGEDLETSKVKVRAKVDSNMDKIPPGVKPPLIQPRGIDDVPAVTLTLWSSKQDDSRLRLLALEMLQRLERIPNTGAGFVVGGRKQQIRIEVKPERLSGYGISLDQVANTIRTANAETRAGSVESGGQHMMVYTGAFLRAGTDISHLVVGSYRGSPVYVGDVATVTQEPGDPDNLVTYYSGAAYSSLHGDKQGGAQTKHRVDAMPAVTIAIAKKQGTNGVTVAAAILKEVESLKGELIPPDVHVELTRNYGKSAADKVNTLMLKLVIATLAVTLLVLFALGWRPALVVTIVIPLVLLVTVFAAWMMGKTIDRVSMFALIFSIGILVDDAIVVIENIYRRWLLRDKTDTLTAIDAVREVGNPTILATMTVIVALLPMALVSGMMGPYMSPIPLLGSVAMLISLLAAFAFTPYLAMRIRPGIKQLHKAEAKEERLAEWLDRLFRGILVPLIETPKKGYIFLLGLVGVFFVAVMLMYPFKVVSVKMLPYDNKPEFSVVIDLKEGTALPVTANVAQQVAERLRRFPEVAAIQTYVGTAKPYDFNGMVRHYYLRDKSWQAEVQVQLVDKDDRHRSSHEIADAARKAISVSGTVQQQRRQGGAFTVVEMPPGPPVLQSVVAEVYGPSHQARRQAASVITGVFRQTDSLTDVDNYLEAKYKVWRFRVDTQKAVRRGISVDVINRNLSMALGGYRLGDVKGSHSLEPTWIVLQVPLSLRTEVNRLLELPITANDGTTVPLGELGRFERSNQDPTLFFKDLRPVEYVVADVTGRLAAPIYGMKDVEHAMRTNEGLSRDLVNVMKVVLPESLREDGGNMIDPPENDKQVGILWAGEWTITYETFRDMGLAFGIAMILIYMLVVWEFGNFVVPLVIMAPIPLTLIGIVPGHAFIGSILGGGEFTATSMIGFIALAGIIVRNSILLVDFSVHEVRCGHSVQEAVIRACKARTRPIIITALALVAGSSVILGDPIFQGMAISLLSGVLVSTVLTLVVIPLGCVTAEKSMLKLAYGDKCDWDDEQQAEGYRADLEQHRLTPESENAQTVAASDDRMMQLWLTISGAAVMAFYAMRAIFILAFAATKGLFEALLRRVSALFSPDENVASEGEPQLGGGVERGAQQQPQQQPSQQQKAGLKPRREVSTATSAKAKISREPVVEAGDVQAKQSQPVKRRTPSVETADLAPATAVVKRRKVVASDEQSRTEREPAPRRRRRPELEASELEIALKGTDSRTAKQLEIGIDTPQDQHSTQQRQRPSVEIAPTQEPSYKPARRLRADLEDAQLDLVGESNSAHASASEAGDAAPSSASPKRKRRQAESSDEAAVASDAQAPSSRKRRRGIRLKD